MKRSVLVIILTFMTMAVFPQQWVGIGKSKPFAPAVKLVSGSEDHVVVSFELGGFYTESVTVGNARQVVVSVPKMVSMLEAGAPDLPLYAIPVIIGDKAEMKARVVDAEYTDFQNIEVAPSKGNLSRQINPDDVPYNYGPMYSQNAFYPASQANLEQPYILRDFRGQNIMVKPFAYNATTKTLRVFTRLVIAMDKVSDNGENQKTMRRSNDIAVDKEIANEYGRRFINFKALTSKYTFIEDVGEMLVICPAQYMEAMQPFVEWKNQSGRPTTMVSIDDAGGNNDTQIKAYIQNIYDNPDRNLTYILLIGDYADLTPHNMSGGRSDNWFGMLEGTDYYEEALVGRFSVESVQDVNTHVNKVLYYERDMQSDATWGDVGIGIGANEGAGSGHNGGEADYVHINYIRDTLMHYTYETVTQQYSGVGGGTNATLISADFNAGATICNYCNHGSEVSWAVGGYSNTHVNALTNDYRWPYIISVACLNGRFNYSQPCFAETWMRATDNTTGVPTGAIGGMFSWTSQAWIPPMTGQDEMNDIITGWSNSDSFHHTMGGASANGNMYILDMHPSDAGISHNTWILFGDPSLLLRTDDPTDMTITTTPDALSIGSTQLTVATNIENGLATLSLNGEILASAALENGNTVLSFPMLMDVGTAKLVVTSYNKVTCVRDIEIVPTEGPYIIYESHVINDENGQADYGETLDMDLTIRNIGHDNANNVTATLTSQCDYVTVINGSTVIPVINAESSYAIEDVFTIRIADNAPDGTKAYLKISCTDSTDTWENVFYVTLHAPNFELVDAYETGNPSPGHNGTLIIKVRNNGTSDAHYGLFEMFSSSNIITFVNPSQYVWDIPAGDTVTEYAVFHVSEEAEYGSAYQVMYILSAQHYSLEGTTMLHAGNVMEGFESGDLSSFDWQTIGSAYWFIDNTNAYSGNYCVRSGVIGNGAITTLSINIDVLTQGNLSFYKKTSTEAGCDKLTFYIDGVSTDVWSGITDWSKETYTLPAGTHSLRWIYTKDSSSSYGEDCVWLDNIEFPPINITYPINAVDDLEASVNFNTITLDWTYTLPGYSFIVRCNGTVLDSLSGMSYTEERGDGAYLYSVTATDGEGHYSMPRYLIVNIGILETNEEQTTFDIFPNPTHDMLNINISGFDETANLSISNVQGQTVLKKEITGTANQIDLSNIAKGLYIMHIYTDKLSFTKKIIIE